MNSLQELNKWVGEIKNLEVNDDTIDELNNFIRFSPEKMADTLVASLKAEGIEIEIVDKYDDWKPWPKDSNLVVIFKLK